MEYLTPFRRTMEFNNVERWKMDRHPLEVLSTVREHYSKVGYRAILEVPGEPERLKWVGIYPQRQGGDAFMLRVKVPGGRLTATQAERVGQVAHTFARGPEEHPVWGNGYCDLTTRTDIQMHWIRIEDVPEIWDLLAEVGVTTVQACGDSTRNVTCCPVAGVDAEEAFDAYPIAAEISAFFTGNREYANLPRKFKIGLTGCLDDCAQVELNDVGLLPSRLEDGTVGFEVLVGGGLGDGARMASAIDVSIRQGDALEVSRAVAQIFGELGNREHRGLNRMRYLAQELGPERFRKELEARADCELFLAGAPLTRGYRGDHVGVHPEHGGATSYVGCSVTVGRIAGADLAEAGRLARTYGNGEVRLANNQNFVLTGVPHDRLEDLLGEELLSRHTPFPGPFSRGAVACTGSEFCRFAIVETKARAASWAAELDRRFAERLGGPPGVRGRPEHEVVRMHFSGCPASCAQPQIADVSFRGETAHVGEEIVEAVDVGFGGSLGADAAFGDWVLGALPAEDVPPALASVVERFLDERRPDEPLHAWSRRLSPPALREALGAGSDREAPPSGAGSRGSGS